MKTRTKLISLAHSFLIAVLSCLLMSSSSDGCGGCSHSSRLLNEVHIGFLDSLNSYVDIEFDRVYALGANGDLERNLPWGGYTLFLNPATHSTTFIFETDTSSDTLSFIYQPDLILDERCGSDMAFDGLKATRSTFQNIELAPFVTGYDDGQPIVMHEMKIWY